MIFPSFMAAVISLITAANAVPASEPLKPWFAIPSRIDVTVSISCPAALKFAAQFLYASPSCIADVLLEDCALASRSAKYPASSACMLKAER